MHKQQHVVVGAPCCAWGCWRSQLKNALAADLRVLSAWVNCWKWKFLSDKRQMHVGWFHCSLWTWRLWLQYSMENKPPSYQQQSVTWVQVYHQLRDKGYLSLSCQLVHCTDLVDVSCHSNATDEVLNNHGTLFDGDTDPPKPLMCGSKGKWGNRSSCFFFMKP